MGYRNFSEWIDRLAHRTFTGKASGHDLEEGLHTLAEILNHCYRSLRYARGRAADDTFKIVALFLSDFHADDLKCFPRLSQYLKENKLKDKFDSIARLEDAISALIAYASDDEMVTRKDLRHAMRKLKYLL